jgi:hypothetical protein
MSVIKCPACGHRHFQAVATCINCGTPLAAPQREPARLERKSSAARSRSAMRQTATEEKKDIVASAPAFSSNRDLEDYERFLTENQGGEDSPIFQPAENPAENNDEDEAVRQTTEALARQLSRHEERQLVPHQAHSTHQGLENTALQAYGPYGTELDVVMPDPFAGSRSIAVQNEQERETAAERWKTDRLPWYFPRTKPQVAGIVMHIESKEEVIDYPDVLTAIVTLLVEFLWILLNIQQERANDRTVITVVRIQNADGTFTDTRLRGNMRGADISLGDQVSLWGWEKRGVLFVRRGYNHTSHGVITTSASSIFVPSIIVMAVLGLIILLIPVWTPLLGQLIKSLFGSIFDLTKKH